MSVPPGAPAAPLSFPPQHPNRQPVSTTRPSTIANIEEHFPGVHCWWGLHTRRRWAFVPTPRGGCLLEAATTDALITQIAERAERAPWIANR